MARTVAHIVKRILSKSQLWFLLICLFTFAVFYYAEVFSMVESWFIDIEEKIILGHDNLDRPIYFERGRQDIFPEFHSPCCCTDSYCNKIDKGRYATLATLRTDSYVPFLKVFACNLRKSNPNLPLIIATVKGDLTDQSEATIRSMRDVTLVYWEELRFENYKSSRFALNWVKIRAWEMVEYDALLVVDVDAVIVGNVMPLFSLPTHFATVLDEDKDVPIYSPLGRMQGGVMMLRPCRGIAYHMMKILRDYPVSTSVCTVLLCMYGTVRYCTCLVLLCAVLLVFDVIYPTSICIVFLFVAHNVVL